MNKIVLVVGLLVILLSGCSNQTKQKEIPHTLKELLTKGPLTIQMEDYANMGKVGSIGQSLPTNNEQISVGPGDIILYQGHNLVIYYGTNSWNFTRIGKIENVNSEELLAALGDGDVSVTFSLEK